MYQTMNPDNLPSSSIRKSNHFKSSKEVQNCPENGRIILSSRNNCGNPTMSIPQHQNHQQDHHHHHQNNTQSSPIGQTHISNSTNNQTYIHETSPSLTQCLAGGGGGGGVAGGGGDMLLQWGQRKRSRCSRMEGRSMAATNHITPPVPHPSSIPCRNNGYGGATSRVKPNGLLYAKDGPGFLPCKNRNLTDQMGCSSSASPSRNGGSSSRAIPRSGVGKRSPSNDKKVFGSGSIRRVKSDDSLPQNQTDSARGEQENGGHSNGNIARSPVGLVEAEKINGEVVECPRIYLSLSRKEKEEDFYAMKGTKLPHRPKKRAKVVDRALQYCFPGLWLSDSTRARYEVRERKSTKKAKRRGLKGLENMESESE